MTRDSKPKFFNHSAYWKYAAIIALCLVTIGFFNTGGRYTAVEKGILPNLDFKQLGEHWIGTSNGIALTPGAPAVLSLNNQGRRQTVITQVIFNPTRYENIRVAADIKINDLVPGKAWWRQAGVILFGLDKRGARMTYWPSEIALLSGSSAWQRYEAVIPTTAAMRRLQLFVFNGGTSGVMAIKNLQVDAVEEVAWSAAAKPFLIVLWLIAGFWILLPLGIRNRKNLPACLSILAFLVMIAGALTPQPFLSETSGPALEKVANLVTLPPAEETPDTENKHDAKTKTAPSAPKSSKEAETQIAPKPGGTSRPALPSALSRGGSAYKAHFVSHIVLTILAFLAFRTTPWRQLIGCLLVASATTEVLQMFVITRSAGLGDGLANIGGVAVGFILYIVWYGLRYRMRKIAS